MNTLHAALEKNLYYLRLLNRGFIFNKRKIYFHFEIHLSYDYINSNLW